MLVQADGERRKQKIEVCRLLCSVLQEQRSTEEPFVTELREAHRHAIMGLARQLQPGRSSFRLFMP